MVRPMMRYLQAGGAAVLIGIVWGTLNVARGMHSPSFATDAVPWLAGFFTAYAAARLRVLP